MTPADPASLADTARVLRRLADDLQQLSRDLAPGNRDVRLDDLPPASRRALRELAAAGAATARLAGRGGAALHAAAYQSAEGAHAAARLADEARAAGLLVEGTQDDADGMRIAVAPGIDGVADRDRIACRATELTRLAQRRRTLAARDRAGHAELVAEVRDVASGLDAVASRLR